MGAGWSGSGLQNYVPWGSIPPASTQQEYITALMLLHGVSMAPAVPEVLQLPTLNCLTCLHRRGHS